ncbi:MAG TPA: HEAT repeat domain-containing protein, partial [Gemmatimonadaceae bacterium]
MHTTLMKYLLIATMAPSTALAQEPPAPPTPPTPPTPAVAPAPFVRVRPPSPPLPLDFDFDFKFAPKLEELNYRLDAIQSDKMQQALEKVSEMRFEIEPKIQIAMDKANFDADFQRSAQQEALRAARDAQRDQMQIERDVQRAQIGAQREVQRAKAEMQRSFGSNFSKDFSYGGGDDRFNSAKPRQGWAKEDPADSLYRSAREALNRGEYRRAALGFSDVVKKFPKSQYALDCQYWEAFARYRVGTTDDLKQAQKLLEDPKMAAVRSNEYSMDVAGLRARIYGALAARGDADAEKKLKTDLAQNTSCDREEISVRGEALNALGQMDIASAMPVVKKVLARRDDCTVELRRRALYLLGRQPTAESVPLMLDVAKNDSDQSIRREAMSWLSRTAGDQAVPMLEDLLKTSNDEQTQRSAVQALGSIDTDKARKAVRAIIERTDALERVRAEAILTLARDRDNRAMGADDMTYLRSLYAKVETQRLKE